MIATKIAALLVGITLGTNLAIEARPFRAGSEKRDTKIIVEVDRSLESLTSDGVKNVQNMVFNSIKSNVTSNIRLVTSYSVLNNAFAISINSSYIDAVKALPGVKSVTENKVRLIAPQSEPVLTDGESSGDYGGSTNESAVTMKKPGANEQLPGSTNDGEGTVIAILDNEFFFRAPNSDEDAFKHETFTELDSSVNVRWTERPDIEALDLHPWNSKVDEYDSTSGYRWRTTITNAIMGEEGSLYLNNKVPYYFDYGGERESQSGDYNEDMDVHSWTSYHGSHVASIAAGNAPTYKGIAPKAQLVCMKVFTNFEASKVDNALGFSDSSGAYDIPILNALEDCIKLGVDGINMSLGSNLDDFDEETISMRTLKKLADQGILSAISAGNAGKTSYSFAGGYGNWTSEMVETGILSGYANQTESMTIASGQPNKTFFESAFSYNGLNIPFKDQVCNTGNSTEYEEDEEHFMKDLIPTGDDKSLDWVYIPNFGNTSDYTNIDAEGKIVFVNRGSIDFATKVQNAVDAQAKGVCIINNDPTATDFNFRCSFGDYKPPIPVALVLFKDKSTFQSAEGGKGKFTIISDKVDVNPSGYTMSTFSSDGAKYDLDLKPEITAPGDYIRGAVPPQKKEDKASRPLSTYEFLSGTSMSAPNYAGAQSVVLSKKAVELKNDPDAYVEYRKTVDMRLMSTAHPMNDYDPAPEVNENYPDPRSADAQGVMHWGYQTSPRLQGAGMADIGGAYNTSVYLEGLDLQGNPIGKSKIALRNSEEINNGTVNLKFLAHNESTSAQSYHASYTVMRPAIESSNEIVSRNYNYRGEVDSRDALPGLQYGSEEVKTGGEKVYVDKWTSDNINVNDVFKVTREVEYEIRNPEWDPEDPTSEPLLKQTIAIGRYVCTEVNVVNGSDGKTHKVGVFETYGSSDYQSTQDYLIKKVDCGTVTIEPGESTITLSSYSLTAEEKAEILDFFKYGTYLEGFVTLEATDAEGVDLGMPWLGFFAGEGQDFSDAPVVEPFAFEKDSSTIYPSELANDIAYSLLGKSYVDMGSSWATTYVEPGKEYNYDKLLYNDDSLTHLAKMPSSVYHLLGTDADGNYYENPEEHLYVGNTHKSNTMIVTQFVLRSVDNNYFTIKNKATGQEVLRDALRDILYGGRYERYPLYKSHVDETYLGSGIVSHRAYAEIPLYDPETGISFDSGDYEVTFNYLLASTQEWISKSYTIHLDSDDPTIDSIQSVGDSVRININEPNLNGLKVGSAFVELDKEYDPEIDEFHYDASGSYFEITKDKLIEFIEDNMNEEYGTGRLYLEMTDKAYGRTGAVVRFKMNPADDSYIWDKYVIIEHPDFTIENDFEDLGTSIKFVKYNRIGEYNTQISVDQYVRVKRSGSAAPAKGGCGGNIATTSVLLTSLAGAFIIAVMFARKKKKVLGGKE